MCRPMATLTDENIEALEALVIDGADGSNGASAGP